MQLLKYLLLIIAVVGQITGIVFLFINIKKAAIFFIIFAIAFVLLIALFVKERLKEKKEEDANDYRDY
jgi:membrane protein implicated in regulation of membrane protease activity